MRLNIRNLVEFCDSDADARPHSNAVKILALEELSLAVLAHYMATQGWNPQIVAKRPTEGRRGKRLDAWIRTAGNAPPCWYQVEVKSWSRHGYGCAHIPALGADAEPGELVEFSLARFGEYWDPENTCFKQEPLNKVLVRMEPPYDREHPVRALVCLWTPILKQESQEQSFFSASITRDECSFDAVWIFSVSGYLRGLLRSGHPCVIDVALPKTEATLNYMRGIFPD